jgi:hypothetical protein
VSPNIVVVGCLQILLSWCSGKDWCLLQVGACKHCNSRLVPT